MAPITTIATTTISTVFIVFCRASLFMPSFVVSADASLLSGDTGVSSEVESGPSGAASGADVVGVVSDAVESWAVVPSGTAANATANLPKAPDAANVTYPSAHVASASRAPLLYILYFPALPDCIFSTSVSVPSGEKLLPFCVNATSITATSVMPSAFAASSSFFRSSAPREDVTSFMPRALPFGKEYPPDAAALPLSPSKSIDVRRGSVSVSVLPHTVQARVLSP